MADNLRGAVAALPRPELGAIADRPENMTSQERDVEAFQATAGEFRKGARSAANSLGATIVGLAGAVGDAIGTDEFAARRWAEAEDFLAMADAVGPRVRDYRTVKDMGDAWDMATGMAGQAAVFMAPALVGGGVAALAGAGLRGAVATGAAASFVPESGESALNTRDLPGTPLKKLGVNLGKGAVNAAIDVLPIGAAFSTIRKASKGVKGAGRAAATIPALTAGEAVTEGVQEKVGQVAESILDPNRDTSEDTPAMINAALQGAVGGGGLGIGTAAASKVASITSVDSAKKALNVRDRIEDPDDFSDVPSDIDKIPEWMGAKDERLVGGLSREFERDPEKYAKYKGFEDDADLQDEFAAEVRKDFTDTVDTPAAQKRLVEFKKFVEGLAPEEDKGVKKSRIRTKLDLEVFDNMKKHLRATSSGLSSTEQLELGDAVKGWVLHSFGQREVIGVPEAKAGETRPVKVPDQLMEEFGEAELAKLASSTFDILKKGGTKMVKKPNFKRGLAKMTKAAKAKLSGLEELVLGAIVDDASIDPHTRSFVAETMTARIREQMKNPNLDRAQFLEDMRTAFGARATEVLDAFETERESITRGFENFGELETPPGELGGQQDPTADDRLKRAYKEGPELEQGIRTLRDAYGDKDVQFRVEPELVEKDGVFHMTGRQFIRAETPDVKVGFTPEELENVKEKHGKAGAANSVVTLNIGQFDEQGEPVLGKNGKQRRKKVAISIPNLMAQVQSDFRFDGKKEGAGYVRAVFMEGMSRLASMEDVIGFAESSPQGLKFPDDMFIGNISKKPYTFGEIMGLERSAPAAARAEEFEAAEKKLLARLNNARKPLSDGSVMKQFAQLRAERGFGTEGEQRYIQFVEESEKFAQEGREGLFGGRVVAKGVVQDEAKEQAGTKTQFKGNDPTGVELTISETEEFAKEAERRAEKERIVEEVTGASTTGLKERGPTGQLEAGLREEEKAGENGVVFTKDPERIKAMKGKMALSSQGNIFVNMEGAKAEVEAGFPYFLGKEKSETSKQKGKVAKFLGLTQARLQKMFPTTKEFVAFLVAHERSHINHNDIVGYPRKADGSYDLMHPAAILIETRATFEAMPKPKFQPFVRPGRGSFAKVAAGMKPAQVNALVSAINKSTDKVGLQQALDELDGNAGNAKIIRDALTARIATKFMVAGLRHVSPKKHAGKFDWRAHSGEGEGAAAFGAGTYLLTADEVHAHYKRKFSADARAKQLESTDQLAADIAPATEYGVKAAKIAIEDGNTERAVAFIKEKQEEIATAPPGTYRDDGRNWPAEMEEAIAKLRQVTPAKLRAMKYNPNTKAPTYHVDLHADEREIMDWNKPISEQSDFVRERLLPYVAGAIEWKPFSGSLIGRPGAFTEWHRDGRSWGVLNVELASEAAKNLPDLPESLLHSKKFVVWSDPGTFISLHGDYLGSADTVEGAKAIAQAMKDAGELTTGEAVYRQITRDLDRVNRYVEHLNFDAAAETSNQLQALGIVGHVYNAVSGRNAKDRNYVIYDDARLENTFVEFSKVGLGAAASTPAQQAEVKRYVEYVLGTEQTEVLFKDMEEAGSFADLSGAEALAISIHALDPLSVGFHEAAHALVSRLRAHDQRSANVLLNAASSPLIQARLRELLKGEPGALEQLADPEERVAYMYQFWAVDKLAVGPKTDTIFQKIKAFLRAITKTVLGVGDNPTQMLQAEMIFRAFHTGKLAQRGAVAEVMSKIVPRDTATQGALGRVGDTAERLWATSDGYIRDFNIPAMTGIANQMFNPGEGGSGMMQTRHIKRNQFMNRVNDVLAKLDSGSEARVLKALQSGKPRAGSLQNTGEARAVGEIRKVLDEIFKYMQESNVKVVEWSAADESYVEHTLRAVKDFFPRSYDREYIEANMNSFAAMLRKNGVPESKIKKTMKNLLKGTKADAKESDFTAGLTFYAPNTMARKLDIPETELEPFLQKDLRSIMYNYVAYTVRRAEYASRFGNQGQKIEEVTGRLASVTKNGDKIPPVAGEAERQGASVEQLKAFSNYVRAMEGSLGDEISPNMRGFMGAVLTYQNMRLLPLALFSSLVDPNGIALRSGDWKQSPKAFVRGLRELVKDLPDADRDFAKLVGAVNSATDQHMVADMYGANYSGRWQKWLNEKLFKLNGMESWNNSMRIVAANAGRQFIIRHATKPNKHSERYLRELGLEKADVQFTDTLVPGDNNSLVAELDLTPQMVDAINKFVDGAVLRPHAGVRPIWMSDPHFMLISNLKQFTYSFQTTIVKRTVHEAMHGNYTPLLVLSSYVPFIIASDIMRAMVSPGGADDDRLDRYDAQDWLIHGVKRAGIMGPGEYATEAFGNLERGNVVGAAAGLAGPTAQQLADIMSAAVGSGDLGRQAARAIPGVPSLSLRR